MEHIKKKFLTFSYSCFGKVNSKNSISEYNKYKNLTVFNILNFFFVQIELIDFILYEMR
jgi:hypothetical protein